MRIRQQSTGNDGDCTTTQQYQQPRAHNNHPAGTNTKQSTGNNEDTTAINGQRRPLHNNTTIPAATSTQQSTGNNLYTTINLIILPT
jgi:hypothetical protein